MAAAWVNAAQELEQQPLAVQNATALLQGWMLPTAATLLKAVRAPPLAQAAALSALPIPPPTRLLARLRVGQSLGQGGQGGVYSCALAASPDDGAGVQGLALKVTPVQMTKITSRCMRVPMHELLLAQLRRHLPTGEGRQFVADYQHAAVASMDAVAQKLGAAWLATIPQETIDAVLLVVMPKADGSLDDWPALKQQVLNAHHGDGPAANACLAQMTVSAALTALRGFAHVHSALRMQHRDMKPGNMLYSVIKPGQGGGEGDGGGPGWVVKCTVADWGAAELVADGDDNAEGRLPPGLKMMATPHFLTFPRQVAYYEGVVDLRTFKDDRYALALTLCAMVVGDDVLRFLTPKRAPNPKYGQAQEVAEEEALSTGMEEAVRAMLGLEPQPVGAAAPAVAGQPCSGVEEAMCAMLGTKLQPAAETPAAAAEVAAPGRPDSGVEDAMRAMLGEAPQRWPPAPAAAVPSRPDSFASDLVDVMLGSPSPPPRPAAAAAAAAAAEEAAWARRPQIAQTMVVNSCAGPVRLMRVLAAFGSIEEALAALLHGPAAILRRAGHHAPADAAATHKPRPAALATLSSDSLRRDAGAYMDEWAAALGLCDWRPCPRGGADAAAAAAAGALLTEHPDDVMVESLGDNVAHLFVLAMWSLGRRGAMLDGGRVAAALARAGERCGVAGGAGLLREGERVPAEHLVLVMAARLMRREEGAGAQFEGVWWPVLSALLGERQLRALGFGNRVDAAATALAAAGSEQEEQDAFRVGSGGALAAEEGVPEEEAGEAGERAAAAAEAPCSTTPAAVGSVSLPAAHAAPVPAEEQQQQKEEEEEVKESPRAPRAGAVAAVVVVTPSAHVQRDGKQQRWSEGAGPVSGGEEAAAAVTSGASVSTVSTISSGGGSSLQVSTFGAEFAGGVEVDEEEVVGGGEVVVVVVAAQAAAEAAAVRPRRSSALRVVGGGLLRSAAWLAGAAARLAPIL